MPTRSRRPRGFTLVELVVVVMILGVLAGIATPRLIDAAQTSAENAVVIQAMEIFDAAELFHARNGRWPKNALSGNFPREFEGLLPERLFTEPSPMGSPYDWNGPGTGVNHFGVQIDSVDVGVIKSIDARYDDGDIRTGLVRYRPDWPGSLVFVIEEK